jgi:hypothetical protein
MMIIYVLIRDSVLAPKAVTPPRNATYKSFDSNATTDSAPAQATESKVHRTTEDQTSTTPSERCQIPAKSTTTSPRLLSPFSIDPS